MRTIKLIANLRDIAGAREIDVPFENGGTVRDLIRAIESVCPPLAEKIFRDGQLTGLVHVFVQGRNVEWLNGLDTVIEDTEDLMLIPPVAGG